MLQSLHLQPDALIKRSDTSATRTLAMRPTPARHGPLPASLWRTVSAVGTLREDCGPLHPRHFAAAELSPLAPDRAGTLNRLGLVEAGTPTWWGLIMWRLPASRNKQCPSVTAVRLSGQ